MKKKNLSAQPTPPYQNLRGKSKAPWWHAWAFPLAAWNFSSQKSSSPFWAGLIRLAKNTLLIESRPYFWNYNKIFWQIPVPYTVICHICACTEQVPRLVVGALANLGLDSTTLALCQE
jgi:hypothetical protein